MSTLVKKQFEISDMHCTSCAMNIDFDLEDVPGVSKATTNYASQQCVVEFDQEVVSEDVIIQTIKKTGYSATVKGMKAKPS